MPWLLDGNNLARGGSRERVRRAALEMSRVQRVRFVVVFDGAPPAGSSEVESLGQVEIHYVPHADRAILDLLVAGGSGWRLATDDRELARQARERGAEIVSVASFWARLEKLPAASTVLEEPVPLWRRELKFFEDARNRLPPSPARVVRRRKGVRRER